MTRVALVTGGSRGIGRAVALELAGHGNRVAINYAGNDDAAAEVLEVIMSTGKEAMTIKADVSDPGDVDRLFAEVNHRLGPVDILVNNAGIARDRLVLRMATADWDEVINTNLRSVYLCSKAALRPMVRAKWGRIINISSVAGIAGNAGQANYAASKAGIIGFTKSVAKEVGSRGITVNAVAPGFIDTDMTNDLSDDVRQAASATIAVGRFGFPREVASAVGYLASDDAAYVTGQVLVVDGGMAL
ncbi:MAG TPA: 3-oxoacyl-[acyl-carrier-protein] reductase [Acidimicrobiia bacterium]|nr:3-oxoacyl-[acyl-carrier-protein] reductase [Acidimicrobiia bacterium]